MASNIDATTLDLQERVVAINRVSKTVKGGRVMKFSALVVVGNGDGIVGFDCPGSELFSVAKALKSKFEFQTLTDIASVDMGKAAGAARFGAVYHFFSHTKKRYVRIAAACDSENDPHLPSLTPLYKGADWHEREAFDMMGIVFDGHPNLRRILMWDAYPWHPLRKDFPLAGKEGSPLPPTFEDEDEADKVIPAPLVGGPFHSPSDGTAPFSTQKEPRSVEKFPDNCTEAEQ